jgi:hypothetical protein
VFFAWVDSVMSIVPFATSGEFVIAYIATVLVSASPTEVRPPPPPPPDAVPVNVLVFLFNAHVMVALSAIVKPRAFDKKLPVKGYVAISW